MNSLTQRRIEIESHFIPKIKAALKNVGDARDIYNADSLNKDALTAIKTKQLMPQPVGDCGFRIRQVTHPAMVQVVIQSMMNEGYIVYEMGVGFIRSVPLQQSPKRNPLAEIEKACKKAAEKFVDSRITEKANKVNNAIHAHNVLVKQAEEALSEIKPFESYLSVIVADEVSNNQQSHWNRLQGSDCHFADSASVASYSDCHRRCAIFL